jgi:hypothetical protein
MIMNALAEGSAVASDAGRVLCHCGTDFCWASSKLMIRASNYGRTVIGSMISDTGLARAVQADILDRLNPDQPRVVRGPTWSLPAGCVTAVPQPAPGNSNAGHAYGVTLSEDEMRALHAYPRAL